MIFLWAFLPIVFILDKIAGKSRKLQNLILLAASLVFYAWGEPRYMWLLLVSILANYVLGLVMDKTQTVGAPPLFWESWQTWESWDIISILTFSSIR